LKLINLFSQVVFLYLILTWICDSSFFPDNVYIIFLTKCPLETIFKANDALVCQMPRTRLFCGWADLNTFKMYKVQILTDI